VTVAKPESNPLSAEIEVLLTFDDGFASVARNALPELKRLRWGAVVFLIAASIGTTDDWDVRLLGRPRMMMDWDDIYEWSDCGIEFGSHTMTHADLTALTDGALKAEMRDSKATLEDKLDRPVRFISYPFGRHDERVRHAASEAGYEAAFATGGELWHQHDKWAIPRVGINGLTSLFEFQSMLRVAANSGGGEGQTWRRHWHGRVFESLNAGSAAVGNWRRARKPRPRAQDQEVADHVPASDTNSRNIAGTAGLRHRS